MHNVTFFFIGLICCSRKIVLTFCFCNFCLREELRKWFLSMETALFRFRLRRESAEAQVGSGCSMLCFVFNVVRK